MQIHTVSFANGTQLSFTAYGAHLISWCPPNAPEQIFLSSKSAFESGKAIRGGIPIVFPQFSDFGPFPRHGFARTSMWTWLNENTASTDNQIILELEDNAQTLAVWPHHFRARVIFDVTPEQLQVGLQIQNTQQQAFSFTAALHTYLAISSLSSIQLQGLRGLKFIDNCNARQIDVDHQQDLKIGAEIDRVYVDVEQDISLIDTNKTLLVQKNGFSDLVVWNPGDKASTIVDLGEGEGQQFICIEAAQVNKPIELEPDAIWLGQQIFSIK